MCTFNVEKHKVVNLQWMIYIDTSGCSITGTHTNTHTQKQKIYRKETHTEPYKIMSQHAWTCNFHSSAASCRGWQVGEYSNTSTAISLVYSYKCYLICNISGLTDTTLAKWKKIMHLTHNSGLRGSHHYKQQGDILLELTKSLKSFRVQQ